MGELDCCVLPMTDLCATGITATAQNRLFIGRCRIRQAFQLASERLGWL
jgi:hypothetical protein